MQDPATHQQDYCILTAITQLIAQSTDSAIFRTGRCYKCNYRVFASRTQNTRLWIGAPSLLAFFTTMSSSLRNAPSTNEHKKMAAGSNYRNRSLSSLLHYFVGIKLQVETKMGQIYSGQLENADAHMNITLDEATLFCPATAEKNSPLKYNPQYAKDSTSRLPPQEPASQPNEKKTVVFPSIHIRGPTIRYLHFPDDLDLQGMIRLGMDRERAAAQKYKRGTRKS